CCPISRASACSLTSQTSCTCHNCVRPKWPPRRSASCSSEVSRPDQLDSAFATLGAERVEGLLVPPDTTFYSRRREIADLAAKTRLPAIYGYREHVEVGGLMSYGPDLAGQYRRAASYVDKILKGAQPADLPVEQPTKIEFIINLKIA